MPITSLGQAALRRAGAAIAYGLPLLLLLAVWEAAARAGLSSPVFLPPVSAVFTQALVLWREGQLLVPLGTSVLRAFAGLALAVLLGSALGIAMTRIRWVRWFFDPLVALGFPSPKITFLPVFILWFGIDNESKILLVAFTSFFPMTVAAFHGAETVNRMFIWSAQAMGASERRILWKIILPVLLPHLFSGLRVTVPVALITAFTAEMIAGGGGVGAALMFAQRYFETPTVFVYLLLMLVTGFVFDRVLLAVRKRVLRWHEETGHG